MRVLIGKVFGIGNAVLSIPMVKAICSVADEVHVMVGDLPDDFGAGAVFSMLEASAFKPRGFQLLRKPPGTSERYDVAVMAIPFDGRWRNGVDYVADRVLDGRKRPDNVERLGFDMWKKHEVLYQMENAYELGYEGTVPGSSFYGHEPGDEHLVYLGVGYKRDPGGFGLSKHFGNARFAELIKAIKIRHPRARFITTGPTRDLVEVIAPIMNEVADNDTFNYRPNPGLWYAFDQVASCGSYLGNDTGMMHVAAAHGMLVHGLFLSKDLLVKNHPWGAPQWRVSSLDADIGEIADIFCMMVWGFG